MKYLLVLAVIAVFYFYWKKQRPATPPPSSRAPTLQPPQQMVACAQCGLHLPARDAVTDRNALHYCSEAHRQQGPHH